MGDFTQETLEYDLSDHTAWDSYNVPYLCGIGQMIISYSIEGYHIICTVIHYLLLQCPGEARGVTNFCWPHLFPVKVKSDAHRALSLLYQWDGVPPTVICDNCKEKVLGEFNRKIKEASCHSKQIEPFTKWLNTAKREIKELKKVVAGS